MSEASLPDLLQLECAKRSECVVRVVTTGSLGYLFLRDGRIVHALTPDSSGQRAAEEILQYEHGSFEQCQLKWPEHETIAVSLTQLLLCAALSKDAARVSVADVPRERSAASPVAFARAHSDVDGDVEVARIGAEGEPLGASQASELQRLAGLAVQLADRIGQELGLGAFVELESELSQHRCLLSRSLDDSVTAARSKSSLSKGELKRSVGLMR